MTYKNAKTILFTSLIAVMILSFSMTDLAEATTILTYQIPLFEDWSKITSVSTTRSFVSSMSTDLGEVGEARLYAKDRSDVTYPQAAIEYTKTITVLAGDDFTITQKTFVDSASFYNQDSSNHSHLVAFPTIHRVGESSVVGYTSGVGCFSVVANELTANVSLMQLTSTLTCNSLTAGDYEISAYVHARANENSSEENASVSATVSDIELSIKRTRA